MLVLFSIKMTGFLCFPVGKRWKSLLPKAIFWEDSFDINYLGESALIRGGTNELNWEIEAKSRATESMLLVDRFRLGQN